MAEKTLERRAEQDYHITAYDNKTIGETGGLPAPYSEFEEKCKKLTEHFKNKLNGRLDITVIAR